MKLFRDDSDSALYWLGLVGGVYVGVAVGFALAKWVVWMGGTL